MTKTESKNGNEMRKLTRELPPFMELGPNQSCYGILKSANITTEERKVKGKIEVKETLRFHLQLLEDCEAITSNKNPEAMHLKKGQLVTLPNASTITNAMRRGALLEAGEDPDKMDYEAFRDAKVDFKTLYGFAFRITRQAKDAKINKGDYKGGTKKIYTVEVSTKAVA